MYIQQQATLNYIIAQKELHNKISILSQYDAIVNECHIGSSQAPFVSCVIFVNSHPKTTHYNGTEHEDEPFKQKNFLYLNS